MFILCLLLWILFNGRFTAEIFLFGVVISAAVYAVSCTLLGFSFEKDKALMRRIPGILKMALIFLREMLKSNLAVTKMVWSGRKLSPCYKTFEAHLRTRAARVVLADCITLTPGTITGTLEGDTLTMHCIDVSMADGSEEAAFIRQLQKIEGTGGCEHDV